MIALIAAAALAAQTPAVQAPAAPAPANPAAQHAGHMKMSQSGEHKGMDCCKDCCKDMAGKHDGDAAEHKGHAAH